MVTHSVTTDRGHRHSNATSYVHIWIRSPTAKVSLAEAMPSTTHVMRPDAPEFFPPPAPVAPQPAGSSAAANEEVAARPEPTSEVGELMLHPEIHVAEEATDASVVA